MKEIKVSEVREILTEVIGKYDSLYEIAIRTPDDKLLKMNLCTDFGLDSLDIEDMCYTLCNSYGDTVKVFNPLTEFSFHKNQTIENFIDMVNYYLN